MKSAAKIIALLLVFALFAQLLPAYALDDLTPSQDESSDTDLLTENDSYSAFFERVQHENYLDLSSDEQRYFLDVTGVDEEQMIYYARNDLDIKASLDCIYIETWTELPMDIVIEAYGNYDDPETIVSAILELNNRRNELTQNEFEDLLNSIIEGKTLPENDSSDNHDEDESAQNNTDETNMNRSGDEIVIEEDNLVNAPYSINTDINENISINTGKLTYTYPILSLPGKNGFDFNLILTYDSAETEIFNKTVETFGTPIYSNINKPKTAEPLGVGWKWNVSRVKLAKSIQSFNYYTHVLQLANGQQYLFKKEANGITIQDYMLDDMKIISYWDWDNLDNLQYLLCVLFKDGRKEYFGTTGNLIKEEDRYGNIIRFSYNASGALTQVTDSLNRTISISYNQQTVVITAPDNSTTTLSLSQQYMQPGTYPGYMPVQYNRLDSIENALGNITSFSYTLSTAPYTYSADSGSTNNYALLLSGITHPTGAISQYTYSGQQESFGLDGYYTVFKTVNRKDTVNNTDYNIYTFTYNGHYSSEEDYNTIVYAPNSVITRYYFNEDHLNTQEERYINTISSANCKLKVYKTYNSNKLLTDVKTRFMIT